MNIDTATGLPELPESDLFFRVKRDHVEIRRRLPDRVIEEKTKRTWWGGKKIVSKRREVKGESESVTWGAIAIPGKELEVSMPFLTSTWWFQNVQDITRENVIQAAEEALSNLDRINLYGDYPPKKLEVEP